MREPADPGEFYRATLQYLTYTPIDTLSGEEQCEIARDLCLAAFSADSIFTFGELLQHPVLQSLSDASVSWMPAMLKALNIGNITAYEELWSTQAAKITAFDLMKNKEMTDLLLQKLKIAALIEPIFRRKADERL